MTTTAASRQALGAYGETLAARLLTVERGMVLLDRNWRCPEGELDLVLRDGDVLVACEVKTRRGDGLRVAPRGGRPVAARAAAPAGLALGRGARRPPRGGPGRPGRRAATPARRRPWSTTSRGWADAVRDQPHRLAHRRRRPPHRRPGRRLAGPGRHRAGRAAPTPRSTSPETAAGWRSSTAVSTGRPRDGPRSCSRPPTCPSAAPTTTSPSRSPSWAPPEWCPPSPCAARSSSAS